VPAAELADFAGFQRIEMVNALRRQRQHGPQCGGITEGVEQRQDAQQHVVVGQPDELIDRTDVRADVPMCEHYTFGTACRAGGEDNRQQVVIMDLRQAEPTLQPRHWREPGRGRGA
jgi:hypothetical protein